MTVDTTRNETRGGAVVDSRAARFNQLVICLLVAVAWLTDARWAMPLIALYVLTAPLLGPRRILLYRVYFAQIQPRFGIGRVEDQRAPMFALAVAGTGFAAASVLLFAGAPTAGWITALTFAVLGQGSILFDRCLGCMTYAFIAKVRGRLRAAGSPSLDPDLELPPGDSPVLVQFMHPLCSACVAWKQKLESSGDPYLLVDVRDRPELMRRYAVTLVPTVLEVAPDGTVLRQLTP